MTTDTEEIFEKARRLPPVERAELLEQLFDTFSAASTEEVDSAWAAEAEDRLNAYRSGELDTVRVDAVMEHINKLVQS